MWRTIYITEIAATLHFCLSLYVIKQCLTFAGAMILTYVEIKSQLKLSDH